jgi:hypothetical protein
MNRADLVHLKWYWISDIGDPVHGPLSGSFGSGSFGSGSFGCEANDAEAFAGCCLDAAAGSKGQIGGSFRSLGPHETTWSLETRWGKTAHARVNGCCFPLLGHRPD